MYNILVISTVLAVSNAMIDPFKDDLVKFDFREKFHQHPFLYFTSEYVSIFRRRAETTHKHIISEIIDAKNVIMQNRKMYMPPPNYKQFAKVWNEKYGNNLAPLALYSLLYPDDSEAFEFILEYMDNMVKVGNWQVIGAETDEVPINHQLAGFATAFDFLYSRFDKKRQEKYAERIIDQTEEMYELSYKRWWGHAYIQNHVATNSVGLLIGALVSRLHIGAEKADPWIKRAVSHYERTMWLFEKIGDGTSNEGVAYGGYTARSLTEYIFFLQRHFDNEQHLESTWLKNHFWFYYATVLPGFQFSVGIADSAPNWWYGPESQLVFLDAYVMKNGSGNWLAQEIDKYRGAMEAPSGQRYTTLHTEFIWYDASLQPRPPIDQGVNRVHIFPDWGVATYGFGVEKAVNNTFLSFKSSYTHGKTIFKYIEDGAKFLDGWDSFNPGHEHPDKNSFVFAPNGEMFITEGLYGPKFTFLDNVCMFGPADVPFQCREPWVGQLGSCSKWLSVKRYPEEETSAAYMINSEMRDGYVHFSGDAAHAYPKKIGLKSWYRNLLLLNPQLLLLHDHISIKENSPLKQVSAFFNNFLHNFHGFEHPRFRGFQITLPDGKYSAVYTSYGGQKPATTLMNFKAKRYLSNANVTFNLEGQKSDFAYVLFGPDIDIIDMYFLQYLSGAVKIRIVTSTVVYVVKLLSNYQVDSLAREFMYDDFFDVEVRPTRPSDYEKPYRPPNPIIDKHLNVKLDDPDHMYDSKSDPAVSFIVMLCIILAGLVAYKSLRVFLSRRFELLYKKNPESTV